MALAELDFAAIDRLRREKNVPKKTLCGWARLAPSTYWFIENGKVQPRPATLNRLHAALQRGGPRPALGSENHVATVFRGWAVHFAGLLGVDPVTALASDPGLRANSDPKWRLASQVRELAAYCTVTELDLGGARVARAIGVTRAAVSLMLRRVEDARDDPTFAEMVEAAARLISGRRE